jgi:cytochrome c553
MRIAFVGALSVAIISGSFAHAADNAAVKEKAEICAGCHGDGGMSQT